jgi:hypothetical protein
LENGHARTLGGSRLHLRARSLSGRTRNSIHLIAFFSAFAFIAAVVFGTLSVHPF